MLDDLRFRFRALLRRSRIEQELDEELQFHIERQTQAYVDAGLTPADARRRARAEFGGLDNVREACRNERRLPVIEDLARDVRHGLRTLRRTPLFTAAAIIVLAVGIGAMTTVFSYVNVLFLRPLAVPEPASLVRIYSRGRDQLRSVSYPAFTGLRDQVTTLGGVAAHQYETVDLAIGGESRPVDVELVSGNYFAVLGVNPARGRLLTADDDRVFGGHPVAVISHRLWQQHFGASPGVIGTLVRLHGHPFTVIGVAPSGFTGSYSAFAADAWVPIAMYDQVRPRGQNINHGGWGWLQMTGRLAAGASLVELQAELDVLSVAVRKSAGTGSPAWPIPASAKAFRLASRRWTRRTLPRWRSRCSKGGASRGPTAPALPTSRSSTKRWPGASGRDGRPSASGCSPIATVAAPSRSSASSAITSTTRWPKIRGRMSTGRPRRSTRPSCT